MSAVEAYHNFRQATGEAVTEESQRADAAIAELEAELAALTEAARKRHNDWCALKTRLTALKARRCEGCEYWREVAPTFHPGRMDCDHPWPISVADDIPPVDFCCNRWQERGK